MSPFHHRADSCDSDLCHEKSLFIRSDGTGYHVDWRPWAFNVVAYAYLAPWLVLIWWLLNPWSSAWSTGTTELSPASSQNLEEYFHSFSGSTECGISLPDLYSFPSEDGDGIFAGASFCPNRQSLLRALSGGGRHGFDAPYTPKGCHYRWYSVDEICMILDRFDSLVFIGDDALKTIFGGLNILLRRDLSLGSLKTTEISGDELTTCRCENQQVKDSCFQHTLTSSHQISADDPNPYLCSRVPLAYLPTTGSPFSPSTHKSLSTLIPRAPSSDYRPIPIVFTLFPGKAHSTALATETMQSVLTIADSTGRKTPALWIGPTATGHLDISGRVHNNEIWRFSQEMEKVAKDKDVEVMGMWNMTVQANSWDGRRFGESVAITQAMMVINWLSRLESS